VTRLQKFIEQGPYGEKSRRVAYVFRLDLLPEAGESMTWQHAKSFNSTEDLLRDAGLKDVFKAAVDKGCVIVTRSD
jgi:hypothetical protein